MEWHELNESDIFAMVLFDMNVHPEYAQPTHDDYKMAFGGEFKFYGLKSSRLSQELISTFQLFIDENDVVLFTGVGVNPEYRSKGYGDDIIRKIEELSKNRMITCESKNDNNIMEKLLLKHNYKLIKTDKDWKTWAKQRN